MGTWFITKYLVGEGKTKHLAMVGLSLLLCGYMKIVPSRCATAGFQYN